jgi:hypothetical protein
MPAPESDQPVGSRRGRSPSGQWMLVSVEWPPGNDCEHNGGCDRGAEIPRGSCVDSACASLQWDRAASEGSTVGCWPRWAAASSASWPAVRTSPQCETGSMQRMLFGECTGGRSRQTGALLAAAQRADIDAELSEDIRRAIWEKFVFLVGLSGVTAAANPSELAAPPNHHSGLKPAAFCLRAGHFHKRSSGRFLVVCLTKD